MEECLWAEGNLLGMSPTVVRWTDEWLCGKGKSGTAGCVRRPWRRSSSFCRWGVGYGYLLCFSWHTLSLLWTVHIWSLQTSWLLPSWDCSALQTLPTLSSSMHYLSNYFIAKNYTVLGSARTLQRFARNYSLWLHTFLNLNFNNISLWEIPFVFKTL